MSDLEQFRDHARKMAARTHLPDCPASAPGARWERCGNPDPHERHEHVWRAIRWDCPGTCASCVPPQQLQLWTRLADEIDQHLAADDDDDEGELW